MTIRHTNWDQPREGDWSGEKDREWSETGREEEEAERREEEKRERVKRLERRVVVFCAPRPAQEEEGKYVIGRRDRRSADLPCRGRMRRTLDFKGRESADYRTEE